MGTALEALALAAVRGTRHDGIIAARKYVDPRSKKELEIDLLLETPEHIFLIEVKKKPLTNIARGGGALRVMVDMSGALLAMLVQLARHERVLRSDNQIVFRDGSRVELKGREVEKIAVSMLDHGSLQDRLFISTIIKGLFDAQLKTSAPGYDAELKSVNAALTELQSELTLIATATGKAVDKAVRNFEISSWWLGVDSLTYLCREHGDLWTSMKPLRHATFRTGDIMTEISHLRLMGR